ncbi:MAG: hypothetical protein QXS93_01725 [Candidatus Micrarchaeia archaeon]
MSANVRVGLQIVVLALLILSAGTFAQYYQVSIVRADNPLQSLNLTYDVNSTSYKDNSISNPDAMLRVCSTSASDLQNKYITLAYADGTNIDGHYIEITHYSVKVTSVPPTLCVNLPLEISSFKAWYPSIPFVLISDTPSDFSSAFRWKLVRHRGWLTGNYTVNVTRSGNLVNVTVINSTDINGNKIIPVTPYLVVGLVKSDGLTTTSTAIVKPGEIAQLTLAGYTGNYSILVNGIGPVKDDSIPPYVKIYSPVDGGKYRQSEQIPFNFLITDNDGVKSCWYTLNGKSYSLPSCDTSYILSSLKAGTYSLVLYAEDYFGNVGHDSITFSVTGGGGGWFGLINITNKTHPVAPPSPLFKPSREDIYLENNYPQGGSASVTLFSNVPLDNVSCRVDLGPDLAGYVRVALNSSHVSARTPVNATIYLDMSPQMALTYKGPTEGIFECIGLYNKTIWVPLSANVYLTVRKPVLKVVDSVESVYPSVPHSSMLTILNTGNAHSADATVVLLGPYKDWVRLAAVPSIVKAGGFANINYTIYVPEGTAPGSYEIPVEVYEYGLLQSTGKITLYVSKRPAEVQPQYGYEPLCLLLLSLLLSLIGALAAYRWKKKRLKHNESRYLPLLYGLAAFLAILALSYLLAGIISK